MKKTLLDVVFASGKRKDVLLSLHDAPKDMEVILDRLKTTRQALLPQVRILEEHHLVTGSADTYELTTIGKLIVDRIAPLVEMAEFLDIDVDYWGTHNLDFIPAPLLNKMSEMKSCEIIYPSPQDLFDVHNNFYKDKNIKAIYKVTNFLYPNYATMFPELLKSNVIFNYIVSEDLLKKIKKDHRENFKDFLATNQFNLSVYKKKMDFMFFTFDEHHILISLFRNNEYFDNKYILCSGPNSIRWGKELFDHFLKDSVPVTEI
ncbi:MAG: winged helix-turn-helix domain-containing protein [Methanosarcinaceae archaeon]|nr:winged helix-turn-helix domain-containing protein [Methanosarcinaceae archaeon]